MANTFKGEMQDYEGNVIYPHTDADVVFCTDGETVQNKLNRTENVIGTITGVTDSAEAADSSLLPTAKALNQVFQSVSNGKRVIASAITDRGINTAADATFQTMAKNIGNLSRPTGNAAAAQVLAGYTFSNAAGTGLTGTMTNRGAVKSTLNAGKSYTIPAGYHNGTGTVTANSLASQTAANATAAQITSGYTAWVNGVKVTGSGADNTSQYNAGYSAGVNSVNKSASGSFAATMEVKKISCGFRPSKVVIINANYGRGDIVVFDTRVSTTHIYAAYSNMGVIFKAPSDVLGGIVFQILDDGFNFKNLVAYTNDTMLWFAIK